MYKEKRFCIRPLDEILKELKEASILYPTIQRIFLADGDALIMPYQNLLTVLEEIQKLFPFCQRVTCYATPKSILTKTVPELISLRKHGLKMVYLGVESGDDEILEKVNKGVSSEEMIQACQMIKEAGIKLSVTLISGLGGMELLENHAIHSAKLINKVNPEYLGLLTLRAEGQAPLVEEIEKGSFKLLDPKDILKETKLFLENIDSSGTIFRANHISNYLNLSGTLNEDTQKMIEQIDKALEGFIPIKDEFYRHLDLNRY